MVYLQYSTVRERSVITFVYTICLYVILWSTVGKRRRVRKEESFAARLVKNT